MIREATHQFLGRIEQTPPVFSAVKQDGVRLYEKARKGEKVEVKKRVIEIFEFEITGIDMPEVDFRVRCSKGTYIGPWHMISVKSWVRERISPNCEGPEKW